MDVCTQSPQTQPSERDSGEGLTDGLQLPGRATGALAGVGTRPCAETRTTSTYVRVGRESRIERLAWALGHKPRAGTSNMRKIAQSAALKGSKPILCFGTIFGKHCQRERPKDLEHDRHTASTATSQSEVTHRCEALPVLRRSLGCTSECNQHLWRLLKSLHNCVIL